MEQMEEAGLKLQTLGHQVLMRIKAEGVDYWSNDNTGRVEAKKKYGFIGEHFGKIDRSDAILVVNIAKDGIDNYIGANTFLEIGFAYYMQKKIFFLNSIPSQPYIKDELEVFEPVIIYGDYSRIF
jgi:hypothetical protein